MLAVSATEADEVEKIKMELLLVRFDDAGAFGREDGRVQVSRGIFPSHLSHREREGDARQRGAARHSRWRLPVWCSGH